MKIKEQTRKLAVGCSKHCFEVVDSYRQKREKYDSKTFVGSGKLEEASNF
ncbi:chlorohydrolase [Streptococcus pneumoniae]|nr:chlorohydrolase [Streptococcus pneumoniae]